MFPRGEAVWNQHRVIDQQIPREDYKAQGKQFHCNDHDFDGNVQVDWQGIKVVG